MTPERILFLRHQRYRVWQGPLTGRWYAEMGYRDHGPEPPLVSFQRMSENEAWEDCEDHYQSLYIYPPSYLAALARTEI